jgi:hypothetical protein
MPMILGRLHGIRDTRTASFEVLISPPTLGSAGRVVGYHSRLLKLHPGPVPRWKPSLIDHRPLCSPRAGRDVGQGPQSPFLASEHGSDVQPVVCRYNSIHL